MKDSRGFTLLELLMVVIIIAILASIALPQYLRTAERTRASEALQMLGALRTAEQRYKAFSPTAAFTDVLADLDIGLGASTMWTYALTPGAGLATHADATRVGGAFATKIVQINLDTGATCTDDPVYGLPIGLGC